MLNLSFPMSVVSDLVKEGDVTAFQSIFPGVDLSKCGFDPRDASDSACNSTVVNIDGAVQQSMTLPPMPNEVHTAIPHLHAFYCHSHNGANMLTPEDAYAVLEIPENPDESFSLRVR